METEPVNEVGSYLSLTALKAKNGITRYDIIREVDSFFVLLFNKNGLKTAIVDHRTLIKMVQDDANEFYFDKKDEKIIEALKELTFDYEKDDNLHRFEVDTENGEIFELEES